MNIRIYGLKNCDTCRKARKWMDAGSVNHEFIDLREEIPSVATLKQWHDKVGDVLLNRRGTTWRRLSDADRTRADSNLPALLHEHPALMKRPVMINGNTINVGFDERTWQSLLKK